MPELFSREARVSRRRVILSAVTSLDGYIAPCDGSISDFFSLTILEAERQALFARVDTLVMGRKTYDQSRTILPEAFVERDCVVLSRTRAGQQEGRMNFVERDVVDLILDLKAQPGRDIWLVGGAEIVAPCLAGGVIDEVIVAIAPMLFGEGTPLFLPIARTTALVLRTCRQLEKGVVQLTYEV